MQVGSIVVVKKGTTSGVLIYPYMKVIWKPKDDERSVYTIREIIEDPVDKTPCARLEEGIIGYNNSGQELAIGIESLIEVMPPDSIVQEIIEQIPEMV